MAPPQNQNRRKHDETINQWRKYVGECAIRMDSMERTVGDVNKKAGQHSSDLFDIKAELQDLRERSKEKSDKVDELVHKTDSLSKSVEDLVMIFDEYVRPGLKIVSWIGKFIVWILKMVKALWPYALIIGAIWTWFKTGKWPDFPHN